MSLINVIWQQWVTVCECYQQLVLQDKNMKPLVCVREASCLKDFTEAQTLTHPCNYKYPCWLSISNQCFLLFLWTYYFFESSQPAIKCSKLIIEVLELLFLIPLLLNVTFNFPFTKSKFKQNPVNTAQNKNLLLKIQPANWRSLFKKSNILLSTLISHHLGTTCLIPNTMVLAFYGICRSQKPTEFLE